MAKNVTLDDEHAELVKASLWFDIQEAEREYAVHAERKLKATADLASVDEKHGKAQMLLNKLKGFYTTAFGPLPTQGSGVR